MPLEILVNNWDLKTVKYINQKKICGDARIKKYGFVSHDNGININPLCLNFAGSSFMSVSQFFTTTSFENLRLKDLFWDTL